MSTDFMAGNENLIVFFSFLRYCIAIRWHEDN